MSPELVTLVLLIFNLHCLVNMKLAMASDPDPLQDFCIPNPIFGSITAHTHAFHSYCKNASEATADDFVYSNLKFPGNFSESGLAVVSANPTSFPGLNTLGMSFLRADLEMGGINAPHFHPRATEVAYVVKGSVYSGFVDSGNRVFAKVVGEGEVMVYPRGLVHFQMNVGDKPAMIFGSFNSQNPGSQKLPAAVYGSGINDQLLEKAFGLSSRQIRTMRKKLDPKRAR